MAKANYADSVRVLAEGMPALARPIVKVLDFISGDLKSTDAEFTAEDGSLGGLSLLAGGGVRLSTSTGQLLSTLGSALDAGGNIDLGNSPTSPSTLSYAYVFWSPTDQGKNVAFVEVDLEHGGGGQSPANVFCQLFRLAVVDSRGIDLLLTFVEISGVMSLPSPNLPAQTYQFTVGADPAQFGGPPVYIGDDNLSSFGFQDKPTTVVATWGQRLVGGDPTNGDWLGTVETGTVIDPGGSNQQIQRRDVIYTGTSNEFEDIGGFGAIPRVRFLGATYADADVSFSQVGNRIDLGKAPDADTDLVCLQLDSTQGGSQVNGQIRDPNGGPGPWIDFSHNDVIGVGNLAALPRQQTYDMRADLVASTDSATSPKLYRIGVTEVKTITAFESVDVTSFEQAIDPATSQAEINTAALVLRRDGVKDYRSFAEDQFSETAINLLVFALYIGHESIPEAEWLLVDEYHVRNLDPTDDSIEVDLVGVTFDILAEFPPQSARDVNGDYTFNALTVADAWLEIHEVLGFSDAQVGGGPSDSAPIVRTLNGVQKAIDLRTELDFIAGGVTISSQGAFKFASLDPSLPPTPELLGIDLEEYVVRGWDLGTNVRVPIVIVEYPNPVTGGGEPDSVSTTYTAADAVIDAYGRLGEAGKRFYSSGFVDWVPKAAGNEVIPDQVGNRLVSVFGTGVQQVRIKTSTTRPNVELGDVLILDQDRMILFDAISATAVRGRSSVSVVVTGIHSPMGDDLTLWVRPGGVTARVESLFGINTKPSRTAVVTYPGAEFTQGRWPEDYADESGMSGNLQMVKASWNRTGGQLRCVAVQADTYECVLGVPLIEDMQLQELALIAHIPVGTLTARFIRYAADGSPGVVLATHVLTNTVARVLDLVVLSPFEDVSTDDTYTVEIDAPLGIGDFFDVYAYALKIREIIDV